MIDSHGNITEETIPDTVKHYIKPVHTCALPPMVAWQIRDRARLALTRYINYYKASTCLIELRFA